MTANPPEPVPTDSDKVRKLREYFRGLKVGESVIETGHTSMYGEKGITVSSEMHDGVSVKWECGMQTSVTWGTRRISDVELESETE